MPRKFANKSLGEKFEFWLVLNDIISETTFQMRTRAEFENRLDSYDGVLTKNYGILPLRGGPP